jgi:hypothetical protein
MRMTARTNRVSSSPASLRCLRRCGKARDRGRDIPLWSRRFAVTLATAILVVIAACTSQERQDAASAENSRENTSWRNWGTVEAEIYFSGLDTLLAQRFADDTVWYVVDTLYWWPFVARRPRVGLEATSINLTAIGRERGRRIRLVTFDEAIAQNGTRRLAGPVVILGPIDMLGEDHALFRLNLYLGLNGQELRRLRCRRVGDRWTVVEDAPEVAS